MFGNVFFRDFEYKMVTHARVFSLTYTKKLLNIKEGLYLSTLLFFLSEIFSYNKMASWEKIKGYSISLPVTENNEIDYKYMENYISELEEERISELEEERISELTAYLSVSGLEDYHLTPIENEIIEKYKNKEIAYKKFKIGDLFLCQTGDVDLQQKDIDNKGEYFINSGLQNNGIKGKTSRKAKIFNKNTITIDFWGNTFYRDFRYKMATHNHVFSLSGEIIKNEKVGLYLTVQMSYFKKIFSYNNMGTWNKFKEMEIELPIKNGKIDFEFMENFINIQQKLAIKSVVDWRNREIKTTKKVI